jgi:hypothetical protein
MLVVGSPWVWRYGASLEGAGLPVPTQVLFDATSLYFLAALTSTARSADPKASAAVDIERALGDPAVAFDESEVSDDR